MEWWYLNGHVRDVAGGRYQFMTCLFKADPRRIKLPFFKFLPLKEAYFIHEIVTDLRTKRTYKTTIPLTLAHEESFHRPLLHVQAASWTLSETEQFHYVLKSPHLTLKLASQKPPLLENQTGYLDLKVKDTYYYSLSRLAAEGQITLGRQTIAVSGIAWLDHQWADCGWQPADDIWVWFSLQLKNNAEIVAFHYGGKTKTKLATASLPDGKLKTTRQVVLTPTGQPWESPKTGARYHLAWQINLPEFGAELTVKPLAQLQEMIFGPLNYWEGGLAVTGTFNRQPVTGDGFLELAGVPVAESRRKLFERELQQAVTFQAKRISHHWLNVARARLTRVGKLMQRP